MPRKKTGRKTGRPTKKQTARRKPGTFRKGKDPRRGVGKKGRSGRTPNAVKADCQEAVFSYVLPKLVNYIKAPKKTASDPGWRWAVDTILDRGFGRVPLPITGDEEGDPIAVRVERAAALRSRLLERLDRIASREEKRS